MAKFSRHSRTSADQLSVQKNTGTNSLRDGYDHEVANLLGVAEPYFGERTGIRCVFQLHPHARGSFDCAFQIEIRPP